MKGLKIVLILAIAYSVSSQVFLGEPKLGLGDKCFQSTPEFKDGQKECSEGFVCRHEDKYKLGDILPPPGAPMFCLKAFEKTLSVSVGEKCFQATLEYSNTRTCPNGYECRYNDEILMGETIPKGAPKFCLLPFAKVTAEVLLTEGQTCFQALPDFEEKMCADGLVCRYPNNLLEATEIIVGAPLLCLKPYVRKTILKEGETCYQSTANFGDEKPCPEGYVCRLSDDLLKLELPPMGAPFKCLRPYTDTTVGSKNVTAAVQAGDTCYQSTATFGAERRCPDGYICRHTDDVLMKRKPAMGAALRCLKPFGEVSAADKVEVSYAGYNEACYQSTPGFQRKKCFEGLVCRVADEERKAHLMGSVFRCLPPVF